VDVGGQGDCFFKSVSHQIHGDAAMHLNIQMARIRYLRDHPERFIHSLADATWEKYINRMSTPGTWCDNLITQAVANALNCVLVQLYRFARHPRFAYWAFNTIQRRRVLQQSGIFLKQNPGETHLTIDELRDMAANINSSLFTCQKLLVMFLI